MTHAGGIHDGAEGRQPVSTRMDGGTGNGRIEET